MRIDDNIGADTKMIVLNIRWNKFIRHMKMKKLYLLLKFVEVLSGNVFPLLNNKCIYVFAFQIYTSKSMLQINIRSIK